MLSPLETLILCDFFAIKHNWTTVINWHFGDGGVGNKKKKKKDQEKIPILLFSAATESFSTEFH